MTQILSIMFLNITPELLNSLIPNAFATVRGEKSLFDKLAPFIAQSKDFYLSRLFGVTVPYDPEIISQCNRLVVTDAFVRALPSLDLVLTPNGFGIVNSTNVAPASADRVKALALSLRGQADDIAVSVLSHLLHFEQWRLDMPGQCYASCCFRNFSMLRLFCPDDDFFTAYDRISAIALDYEQKAAERYIGRRMLDVLLEPQQDSSRQWTRFLSDFRSKELEYIRRVIAQPHQPCDIWPLVRPLLADLDDMPEVRDFWLLSRPASFREDIFTNSVKGAFFF